MLQEFSDRVGADRSRFSDTPIFQGEAFFLIRSAQRKKLPEAQMRECSECQLTMSTNYETFAVPRLQLFRTLQIQVDMQLTRYSVYLATSASR